MGPSKGFAVPSIWAALEGMSGLRTASAEKRDFRLFGRAAVDFGFEEGATERLVRVSYMS